MDRGWSNRARLEADDHTVWMELFRGSPIISLFYRFDDAARHRIELTVDFEVTEVLRFDDNAPVRGTAPFALVAEETTKPFVVLLGSKGQGVVFFLPHRPEVRRWYVEDYVVAQTPDTTVELGASKVRFEWAPRFPEGRTTLDVSIAMLPFEGDVARALDEFAVARSALLEDTPPFGPKVPHGYWTPRPGGSLATGGPGTTLLRMSRYFPPEGLTFVDAEPYAYGHPDGYIWGVMTKTMKSVTLDPLAERALERDQAFRMLTFFLEAGDEKGAPPNLSMHPQWASKFSDPELIRTIVFCQYWEFRIREFIKLMTSPLLTAADKTKVYEELQRARVVHDPNGEHSWVSETPNGGLWFDYLDIPLSTPHEWIINTHATTIANIGNFALLARQRDRPEDEAYWTDLFRRGLLGMDYAVEQRWMWHADDPNEIGYSKTGGPAEYHVYMLVAWLPDILEAASQIAPETMPPLFELMRRMMKAEFLADRQDVVDRAKKKLARFEEFYEALTRTVE